MPNYLLQSLFKNRYLNQFRLEQHTEPPKPELSIKPVEEPVKPTDKPVELPVKPAEEPFVPDPFEIRLRVPFGYELVPLRLDIFHRLGLSSSDFQNKVIEIFVRNGCSYDFAVVMAQILSDESGDPVFEEFQQNFAKIHFVALPSHTVARIKPVYRFALDPDPSPAKFDEIFFNGRFITNDYDAKAYVKYAQQQGFIGQYRKSKEKVQARLKEYVSIIKPKKPKKEQEEEEITGAIARVTIPLSQANYDNATYSGFVFASTLFKSFNLFSNFIKRVYYVLTQLKIKKPKKGPTVPEEIGKIRPITISREEFFNLAKYGKFIVEDFLDGHWERGLLQAVKLGSIWKSLIGKSKIETMLSALSFLYSGIIRAQKLEIREFTGYDFLDLQGINRIIPVVKEIGDCIIDKDMYQQAYDLATKFGFNLPKILVNKTIIGSNIKELFNLAMRVIGYELSSIISNKEYSMIKHITNISQYKLISAFSLAAIKKEWDKLYQDLPEDFRELFLPVKKKEKEEEKLLGLFEIPKDIYTYIQDTIFKYLHDGLFKLSQFLAFFENKVWDSFINTLARNIDRLQAKGAVKTQELLEPLKKIQDIYKVAVYYSKVKSYENTLVDEDIRKKVLLAMEIYNELYELLFSNKLLSMHGGRLDKYLIDRESKVQSIMSLDDRLYNNLKPKIDEFTKFVKAITEYEFDSEQIMEFNNLVILIVSVFRPIALHLLEQLPKLEHEINTSSPASLLAGAEVALDELDKVDVLESDVVYTYPDQVSLDVLSYSGLGPKVIRLLNALLLYDPVYIELFYDMFRAMLHNTTLFKEIKTDLPVLKEKEKRTQEEEEKYLQLESQALSYELIDTFYYAIFSHLIGNIIPKFGEGSVIYREEYGAKRENYLYQLIWKFVILEQAEQKGKIYIGGKEGQDNVISGVRILFISSPEAENLLDRWTDQFPNVYFIIFYPYNVVVCAGSQSDLAQLWALSRGLSDSNNIGTIMTVLYYSKLYHGQAVHINLVRELYINSRNLYGMAKKFFDVIGNEEEDLEKEPKEIEKEAIPKHIE